MISAFGDGDNESLICSCFVIGTVACSGDCELWATGRCTGKRFLLFLICFIMTQCPEHKFKYWWKLFEKQNVLLNVAQLNCFFAQLINFADRMIFFVLLKSLTITKYGKKLLRCWYLEFKFKIIQSATSQPSQEHQIACNFTRNSTPNLATGHKLFNFKWSS